MLQTFMSSSEAPLLSAIIRATELSAALSQADRSALKTTPIDSHELDQPNLEETTQNIDY